MTNPMNCLELFFFSSRRRHTRWPRDWSSDVCSSDLVSVPVGAPSSLTEPITSTEPVGIGELPPPAVNGLPAPLDLLAQRAGVRLAVPDDAASLCCGTPFSSKGMTGAKERMRQRVRAALLEVSRGGELPVIVDAASCTEGIVGAMEGTGVEVVDAGTFVCRHLLGRLEVGERAASVTVSSEERRGGRGGTCAGARPQRGH